MSRKRFHESFRRLRQTETCPQIHRQSRNNERNDETPAYCCRALPRLDQCPKQNDQEDREREDLERQTSQEDVVRRCGIFAVRIGYADQCCAGDLDNSRNDIAYDEDPEDELRRHGRVFSSVDSVDHDRYESIDCCGEEDRCDDNEEVL